jgi:elongator complex protein 3
MIRDKKIKSNKAVQDLLTLKNTRSLSGIVVISVLTKPYDCPGKCLYCPTEKNVPKSYFSNEPAVMRAISCSYDPYLQALSRLKALDAVGHTTDKINIRIIGGTWSYYPKRYQTWFIKKLFAAANNYQKNLDGTQKADTKKANLLSLQKENETSKHRIVEISIETRQDYINKEEIKRLRTLGVTKVELGVQSVYDDVLKLNRRGHDNQSTIDATKLLKDAGFKVSYQMMLNLPGSSQEKDFLMFQELFGKPEYKPDHLKVYPLALVRESGAYTLYKKGQFKPYTKEELISLISKIKPSIPYYCRIERVIRDIPANMIVEGGSRSSNLRQEVNALMAKNNLACKCIRCREIRTNFHKDLEWKVFREDYDSADGRDIFLSVESDDRERLLSMLRLRIPSQYFIKKRHFIPILNQSVIIRELHTYGPQVPIGEKSEAAAQHQGFGKLLVGEAEKIAREFGLEKVAVISGVGVRGFFASLGYNLKDTYMIKCLGS